MKIVKIKYTDMQGNHRIIDKQENKFTYKNMLEHFNMIYLNCSGQIKVYLKGGDIKIYLNKHR